MLKANASLIGNWIYRRNFIGINMKCYNGRFVWRDITNWNACNDIRIWDASSIKCKTIRFKGSSVWNKIGKNNICCTNISAICNCNGVGNILPDIYRRYIGIFCAVRIALLICVVVVLD